jgi:hypothetical protein
METATNARVEQWADIFRQVADNCAGCGPEVAAISLLKAYAGAKTAGERMRAAAALDDVLAALDIVDAEKLAR